MSRPVRAGAVVRRTGVLVTAVAVAAGLVAAPAAPTPPAAAMPAPTPRMVVGPVAAVPPTTQATQTTQTRSRKKRPAVVEKRIIGRSVSGRPIRAWRLGDPQATRTVVMMAVMHGDEPGPARILRRLRDGRAITGADIWVIPVVNPDGRARNSRRNANGVDLNRNFPVKWVRRAGPTNSGPAARSEPETRALMRFLKNVRPRFVISLHQPLYGIDTSYTKPQARTLARRLVRHLRLPAKVFNCSSGCHGTMTQWFNKRLPGGAITVEYGSSVSPRQARVTGPRGLLKAVSARRVKR